MNKLISFLFTLLCATTVSAVTPVTTDKGLSDAITNGGPGGGSGSAPMMPDFDDTEELLNFN